jgi:hypothetical protein
VSAANTGLTCSGIGGSDALLCGGAVHAGEIGLAPGEAVECSGETAAIRRAEAMSRHAGNAGAVAFSRRGDPNLGEFEDAEIVKTFGDVPEDFR